MADFDLVSVAGGDVFRLCEGHPAVVGRGSTTQLTITDSSISRHHARLQSDGAAVTIEDLRSTNGTFLNNLPVTKATALEGDVVRFGNVAFQVRRVVEVQTPLPAEEDADEELVDATVLRALPVAIGTFAGRIEEPPSGAPVEAADSLTPQEQRLRRLELLLDVSKTFSQNASLDELLETIVDVTCRIMRVHRVSILLVDSSGELQPLVSRQLNRRVDTMRLPASILRRVVTDKMAVRTDDAAADNRFAGHSVILQNVCGAMCTPLLSSTGDVLGALYVDNLTAVGPYTDEDLEFLVTFGGIAAAAVENNRLAEALRTKAVALSNFERYFAPDLAAAITSERAQVQLGGVKRPAAILFSDIRGFSAMSEHMLPDVVVKLLNEYFSEMVDIVFDHGGTLDKFIGDAIMANWGAPLSHPDDADRALRAAIEMQRELRAMNANREPGEPRFEVGIGINRGEVFVGNIGSHRRLEYTMIGDPVNVASRLCSTAGRGEIIISDSLYAALSEKPEVEVLTPVQLRGRAATTTMYRVRW